VATTAVVTTAVARPLVQAYSMSGVRALTVLSLRASVPTRGAELHPRHNDQRTMPMSVVGSDAVTTTTVATTTVAWPLLCSVSVAAVSVTAVALATVAVPPPSPPPPAPPPPSPSTYHAYVFVVGSDAVAVAGALLYLVCMSCVHQM